MKRLLIVTALMATMTTANAGDTVFGGLGDLVMKGRNAMRTSIPTQVFALEADGGNFRFYEFDAPRNPRWSCFVVAGTQKGGPACYPKAK